jgi:hypothetical protein
MFQIGIKENLIICGILQFYQDFARKIRGWWFGNGRWKNYPPPALRATSTSEGHTMLQLKTDGS